MRRFWPWLLLAGCVVLIGSGAWLLRPPWPDRCDPRPDDPTGYLQPICQHILANNIDVSPANPNGYRIKRVEARVEGGREVFWVFLDCCYLGDIAVIDKESGAVLSFRPGAK
jgi:hypothetical protein